ncbi:MAG: dynamin family protein [Methylotenera sp.]|nr:dynamin family protein [Methylotenera sp.]MDO9233812.1 dynamin family protein [Methylotenera sp.]MDO9389091.1 dynamin family protein [Methylotenera sp.]MDP2100950.1 dynamin family protein [Methylotenera sp.]MDP2282093.1 dynamin family protein [Methylotenera sp.]
MSIPIPNSASSQVEIETSTLSTKINEYSQWRENLITTIDEFIDWPGHADALNAIQELRLYDIKENIKKDQLVLAFLAEFSRGKTETINALFFSDFNQRLLPSEPGRTTMCPNEIFWNDSEEPCIKLLPIETRSTDDTLTYLKSNPNVWHKIRLDTTSASDMKETLRALVQKKEVSLETAKKLGFWNEEDPSVRQLLTERNMVEIPVWRHALINYPHQLLKNGLVVIDTPGLNTMGAEPELTLSIIPNAQAVLFLTATDTGITKSDMQIWTDYVQRRAAHKLVVLNKIDILWDGLETDVEVEALIQKQIKNTAHELSLDAKNIFAISAQKALVAKIRKDDALLKRSGINALENSLADLMVSSKHEILGRAVVTECSNMIRSSRKLAQIRINSVKNQLTELQELQSRNRNLSKEILANVVAERKRYEASILTFNQGGEKIKRLSSKLLRHLSLGYLDTTLAQTKQDMGDSWTTAGLNKSMRDLTRLAINLAEEIGIEGHVIKKHADDLYHLFWSKHGFEKTEAVELDMTKFIKDMQALEKVTVEFCSSPANILTEKHFLIRRFFLGLGVQIQAVFEQAHLDCNRWLNQVIGELKNQINVHKIALDKRAESLMESHNSTDNLLRNIEIAQKELAKYQEQSNQLDTILLKLMRCVKFSPEKQKMAIQDSLATPSQVENDNIKKDVILNNAPFIGETPQLS